MKTKITQNLKPIVLAIIALVGVGYVSAQGWTSAPPNPPLNNAPKPINVGDEDQTKAGDLIIPASGVMRATNLVANNFTFTGSGAQPGMVLKALDSTGKVGWGPVGNTNPVTKIIAGNNITVSPTTGVGDVTISSLVVRPVEVGTIAKNTTKTFSSNWKMIEFNGQYTAGGEGDAGPAGGYIIKDENGAIHWCYFYGQATSECDQTDPNGYLMITSSGSSVTIKTHATHVQLSYVMYN